MSRLGKALWFIAGICLVSFAVVRFLLGTWVPFLWVSLGLSAVAIIAAFVVDHKFYREFFALRTTRQGMSMGAMILLVLVLLISINFLSTRYYKTFDFSLNQINTLSEQSIQLAKQLDDELKVIYFYEDGAEGVVQNKRAFIDLIRKYQDVSSHIKLEFVEVNERPDLAELYGIKKGTYSVVLDYKGRRNVIEKIEEQEITSALAKVTRQKEKRIYVLAGHGEASLESAKDGRSLAVFKSLLEGNRYQVETLTFSQASRVPDDADVLMVWGPQQQFLDFEVKAIIDYLKKGGSLILGLEPWKPHQLGELLNTLGIKEGENVVVTVLDTPFGRAVNPEATRGTEFSTTSSITKPFSRNEMTVFRLPQSLSKIEGKSFEYSELVKTGSETLAFSSLNFNEAQAKKGPFTLAFEIKGKLEGAEKSFHAVVLGDEDIFLNRYLYLNLNRDLALNIVSALAKEENLISITPKEIQATQLNMTQTDFVLFIFALVIPLPVLFFILSGVQWFRRRNA
ncbi:MAG: GldG family protein [Bdellovibrionaceae bacterium]|nr:GldG family protein [Pseudobdellovibrionaceae bacterium]MDW8190213.1 GldG family protein [Pseudobdellovibrionaceae bacterium]